MCRTHVLRAAVFLLIALLPACKDNVQGPEETPEFSGNLTVAVFPDIGTLYTAFQFTPQVRLDGDSLADPAAYQYRFDWEADGTWDTGWLDSTAAQHRYDALGKKSIRVLAKDAAGAIDTAETRVYVQELVQITRNVSGSSQGNIDWAPDGSNRIAFDWDPELNMKFNIWLTHFPEGTLEQVTFNNENTPSEFKQLPEWSPDGKKIAYVNNEGFAAVDLATGKADQLWACSGCYPELPAWNLCWAPDGKGILFSSGSSIDYFDMATKTVQPFYPNPGLHCWSPSAKYVAYAPVDPATITVTDTLKIFDFSTKHVINAFPGQAIGAKLDWSPDGRFICLGFQRDSEILHIFDTQTQKTFTAYLGEKLQTTNLPTWSHDEKFLAFEAVEVGSGRHPEIWAVKFPEELE